MELECKYEERKLCDQNKLKALAFLKENHN